jgi:hypothetical protein
MGMRDDALDAAQSHDAVKPMPGSVIRQISVSDVVMSDVSSQTKDLTRIPASRVELDRFMRDVRIEDVHGSLDLRE